MKKRRLGTSRFVGLENRELRSTVRELQREDASVRREAASADIGAPTRRSTNMPPIQYVGLTSCKVGNKMYLIVPLAE